MRGRGCYYPPCSSTHRSRSPLAARRQHTTRHDLTGPDGPPASALKRTPGRDRDVDLVLKEVARRLLGRLEHEPPPRGWQLTATLRTSRQRRLQRRGGRHDSDVDSDVGRTSRIVEAPPTVDRENGLHLLHMPEAQSQRRQGLLLGAPPLATVAQRTRDRSYVMCVESVRASEAC